MDRRRALPRSVALPCAAALLAAPATPTLKTNSSLAISSFGEGGTGELYVLDLNGRLFKIVQG